MTSQVLDSFGDEEKFVVDLHAQTFQVTIGDTLYGIADYCHVFVVVAAAPIQLPVLVVVVLHLAHMTAVAASVVEVPVDIQGYQRAAYQPSPYQRVASFVVV